MTKTSLTSFNASREDLLNVALLHISAISLLLFFVILYLLNSTITVQTLCLAPKVLAKLTENCLWTGCRISGHLGPAESSVVSKRTNFALNKYH